MRLLFAITVCSFCAGLWVAIALARRIRRGQRGPAARHDLDPTHEFFEAGEYRTPRPLRLDQEILQQKPRRPLSEFTFASSVRAPAAKASAASRTPITPSTTAVLPELSDTLRKRPQSIRSSIPRRIDLKLPDDGTRGMASQFGPLLRGSGTHGPVGPILPNR